MMNRIKKRSHRERRVGIVHRSRQSMISCGSEARGSSGGTVGREVEVEVEREREREMERDRGRGVVEGCCFRKTPNKLPFPADESGIMLNFVFAKKARHLRDHADNETERLALEWRPIPGFYEGFNSLCSSCFELLKTKLAHHSRQKDVRGYRTKRKPLRT